MSAQVFERLASLVGAGNVRSGAAAGTYLTRAADPPRMLAEGDGVEAEIEGLRRQRQAVRRAQVAA